MGLNPGGGDCPAVCYPQLESWGYEGVRQHCHGLKAGVMNAGESKFMYEAVLDTIRGHQGLTKKDAA